MQTLLSVSYPQIFPHEHEPPFLSAAAYKRIEAAEQAALEVSRVDVAPFFPEGHKFRVEEQVIAECGERVLARSLDLAQQWFAIRSAEWGAARISGLLREKTLPGVKMGPRQWRVPAEALKKYVADRLLSPSA